MGPMFIVSRRFNIFDEDNSSDEQLSEKLEERP